MIYKVIALLFSKELTKTKLDKMDILEIHLCYMEIQLYIQELIHNKFTKISEIGNNENIEIKGSYLDDYDLEEGYETEEEIRKSNNELYKEILNYNIKYSIERLKNSYKESTECNLSELLDFIIFDKNYRLEYKNNNSENND